MSVLLLQDAGNGAVAMEGLLGDAAELSAHALAV